VSDDEEIELTCARVDTIMDENEYSLVIEMDVVASDHKEAYWEIRRMLEALMDKNGTNTVPIASVYVRPEIQHGWGGFGVEINHD